MSTMWRPWIWPGQELPKPLLMYFTYNNDTLGDNKKAFIYSRVIADKEADPANYQSYQKSMAVFAKKQAVRRMYE